MCVYEQIDQHIEFQPLTVTQSIYVQLPQWRMNAI